MSRSVYLFSCTPCTQLNLVFPSQLQSENRGGGHHPGGRDVDQRGIGIHMHRCIQGRFAQTISWLRFLPWAHDESSVPKTLFSDNPALASQKFKNYIYRWRVSGAPRHALFLRGGVAHAARSGQNGARGSMRQAA